MKIKIDQEKCIGCGSCQAICPDVFDIDDDGKAHLKDGSNQENVEDKSVQEAIDICPVQAIKISE